MFDFEALTSAAIFRLSSLTWADALDLLLVTFTFFVVFQLVRRSQAASILRGLLILGALLLAFTLLLPLPTFSTIVQVMALASLVVIPVILQPELRRWLERLGRNQGFLSSSQLSLAEQNVRILLKATEEMSAHREGALIVLEGRDSLQAYVEGGVSIKGQMTSELLQSIFYSGNPLHDGAVIVRDELVEAAGCVLPLAQTVPVTRRRLGTRHRAAVGITEISDALSIVVSEETGAISTARFGKLEHALDSTKLRKNILGLYAEPEGKTRWERFREIFQFSGDASRLTVHGVLSQLGYLLLSVLLALALWGAVAAQQNPIRETTIANVPLSLINSPDGWVLTSSVPETVNVSIRTDESTVDTVGAQSFQATVDLSTAVLGLQRLPVDVETSVENVFILGSNPADVDVNLSESKTVTMTVDVVVADPESLPSSYQMVGTPQADPTEVEISGPSSVVDLITRAEVTLTLNGTTASVRSLLPVKPIDETGAEVTGATADPGQVLVTATIRRESNVKDVGVRVVTEGSPPDGYWLSGVSSEPASVTLRGAPADLEAIGSFIEIVPVDISEVRGQFQTQSPLDLPTGVDAIDEDGRTITSVSVSVETTPLIGELVVTRDVVVEGLPEDAVYTVDPATVQVLISGPVPTLNEIEQSPDLVQVIDVSGLEPGESQDLTPEVIAPSTTDAQLIDQVVIVTREP
ncbi:MAG: diadenylate cyclase CdaA [Chloroflexota bacterium]